VHCLTPPATRRGRAQRLSLHNRPQMPGRVGGLVLFATVLAGCAATHDIHGTIALTDLRNGPECGGFSGEIGGITSKYADIQVGAQVTVKNQDGTIIGLGKLQHDLGPPDHCTFAFTIGDVPDASFYSVEVTHRGALTYSAAEIESAAWTVTFTLGP
jgi:hypothetical protein